MYHTIDEFIAEYRYETESTKKVLANLTDASLEQRVVPDGRSIGRLAWHLAVSIPQMAHEAGIRGAEGSKDDEAIPATAAEILAGYQAAAESFMAAVKAEWSDAELPDMIPMYGDSWSKALTLSIVIRHEIHHRGQLTVLMRQAGLPVHGCYGPAKEDWAAMGMAPMA